MRAANEWLTPFVSPFLGWNRKTKFDLIFSGVTTTSRENDCERVTLEHTERKPYPIEADGLVYCTAILRPPPLVS